MNRRSFAKSIATAALACAAPGVPALAETEKKTGGETPYPLSAMLWTVFNDLPFEQRLEKVAEAGYRNVELVGEYSKWTPQELETANAARKRLGISFGATAGLKHGLGDPSVRQQFLDELQAALKPMEMLEIPAMIVLSGNVVPGLSHAEQQKSCIDGLNAAATLLQGKTIAGKPVKLLLECIDPEENPKYFLQSAAEAIEVIRAVNHPQVRFLYDLFHEQIAEGDLIEKLDKHSDVIDLIHVADVPGRHEPGTGEINYANVYRKLAQVKYRGVVAMEFKPRGNAVEALRKAAQEVSAAVKG